jgi:hypothetical protein
MWVRCDFIATDSGRQRNVGVQHPSGYALCLSACTHQNDDWHRQLQHRANDDDAIPHPYSVRCANLDVDWW